LLGFVGCWDRFTDIWCECLAAALSTLATQGPSTSLGMTVFSEGGFALG
jgi:hypothetical protein